MHQSKRVAALGTAVILSLSFIQACGSEEPGMVSSETGTDVASFESGSNSSTSSAETSASPSSTGGTSSSPSANSSSGPNTSTTTSANSASSETGAAATNPSAADETQDASSSSPTSDNPTSDDDEDDNPTDESSDDETNSTDASDDEPSSSDEPDDESNSTDASDDESSSTEGTSSVTDSTSDDPPEGDVTMGQGGVINATIVVRAGEIFDGGGKTYTAGSALGDGSQDEDQLPVFRLEDGAQIRNVVLGSPAADGIHCYGDVTLNDITWSDIGEDALTVKESGTVILDGGSAQNGDDKVFQINAASTFIVRNFTARNAGKFIRQNGDTTFKVDVVIENCDISAMDECIFRTDSSSSTVTMTDTRYSDLGDGLFVGVNENNITLSNNEEY